MSLFGKINYLCLYVEARALKGVDVGLGQVKLYLSLMLDIHLLREQNGRTHRSDQARLKSQDFKPSSKNN